MKFKNVLITKCKKGDISRRFATFDLIVTVLGQWHRVVCYIYAHVRMVYKYNTQNVATTTTTAQHLTHAHTTPYTINTRIKQNMMCNISHMVRANKFELRRDRTHSQTDQHHTRILIKWKTFKLQNTIALWASERKNLIFFKSAVIKLCAHKPHVNKERTYFLVYCPVRLCEIKTIICMYVSVSRLLMMTANICVTWILGMPNVRVASAAMREWPCPKTNV